jgi:hypothetical protein
MTNPSHQHDSTPSEPDDNISFVSKLRAFRYKTVSKLRSASAELLVVLFVPIAFLVWVPGGFMGFFMGARIEGSLLATLLGESVAAFSPFVSFLLLPTLGVVASLLFLRRHVSAVGYCIAASGVIMLVPILLLGPSFTPTRISSTQFALVPSTSDLLGLPWFAWSLMFIIYGGLVVRLAARKPDPVLVQKTHDT